jgi:hypothetical protein
VTTCILTFDPTGTGHGLYTEVIDLAAIGTLEIHRATTIEFNNATQAWEVKDNGGEVRYADPSRQTCLEWEQSHFNRR